MYSDINITNDARETVYNLIRTLYKDISYLPFHGWHHVEFVYRKVGIFSKELGADTNLSQVCALVHDLNYVTHQKKWTASSEGQDLRRTVLQQAGIQESAIDEIESIIIEAATENRSQHISTTAKALSDADTLFKALPITPILFASRFIQQTGYNIQKLAKKVIDEQKKLFDDDIYFYSDTAKREYNEWAGTNLKLWENVLICLSDHDVLDMLSEAGFNIEQSKSET